MKRNFDLIHPTEDSINDIIFKFKKNYKLQRPYDLIRDFCIKNPTNDKFENVVLKSSIINSLYSTHIYNIFGVAEHIYNLSIDSELQNGSDEIVEKIGVLDRGIKKVNNYSFATKYCSFHFPKVYYMYDKYVAELLVAYKTKDQFAKFYKKDLRHYPTYKNILDNFKLFYNLQNIENNYLDNFLWLYGKTVFK